MLFVDECHLLWNDACGYVWGPRNQRIEMPIASLRKRQSYYGAINAQTGEATVIPYDEANGRWAMIFIEVLREHYAGRRLIICWDDVSYHRSEQMREYLDGVNMGIPRDRWEITSIQFAPYAPQQNPTENMWLQAKTFIRKNWRKCRTFQQIIDLFE